LFNTETFKVEYEIKGIHPTVQAEFSPKHHHIINRNSSEVNLLEVSKDKIKGCSFNNDFNNCSAISYDDKLIAIVGNYYDTCTVKQISTGKTVSEIIFEDESP
jgi:hypothetical protein